MTASETTIETTALLVPLPGAGRAIDDLRRLDPASSFGVPAHVTVLFPFAPVEQIGQPMRERLRRLFSAHRRFEVEFRETRWFGDAVLWLAPADPAPFSALTRDVMAAFPAWLPYEGAFDEVVPHFTIGDTSASEAGAGAAAALRAAEAAIVDRLPLFDLADRVLLMAGRREEASWWTVEEFPLA
jgi:2'-5' RNA ligase